jgi:hypothetical protein
VSKTGSHEPQESEILSVHLSIFICIGGEDTWIVQLHQLGLSYNASVFLTSTYKNKIKMPGIVSFVNNANKEQCSHDTSYNTGI